MVVTSLALGCSGSPRLHDTLGSFTRRVPGLPEPQLEYIDAELSPRLADASGRLEVFADAQTAAVEALRRPSQRMILR